MYFSIESILITWAKCWAREKGVKGYPSLNFENRLAKPSNYSAIRLSDDDCIEIDRLVMKLHDYNLQQYQILMAVYLQDIDDKVIRREIGIGKSKFREELLAAKSFISGGLIARGVVNIYL